MSIDEDTSAWLGWTRSRFVGSFGKSITRTPRAGLLEDTGAPVSGSTVRVTSVEALRPKNFNTY